MQRHHVRCDSNRLRLLLSEELPAEQQAEVMGHLDDCAACQQAIEGLAADKPWWDELRQVGALTGRTRAEPEAGRGDGPDDPLALDFLDAPEAPGELGRLASFAVSAVIGRGGMGVVLKALDAGLNRPVAIKVLAPHFASSGAARKRFAREAQAAAAVAHDHVVAIHGVDTWKGLPYLVMAYVAGRSLQERLDAEGPLGVKEILRIGMQTAAGLAAAHAQGLVHRDVKPANILLENGVERVRLTDFGLARAVDDASLTQSGVVAGTPQYMAPEQARGEAVDHRADLFALGSTLYALCTGHAPFRAESAMAVLRRVSDDQPRPIREINPDIPAWLAGVVERLHAKNPAERFQSAAEVADLLGRCLAHVQQPDSVPLPEGVAGSATARRRARRAAAATLLLVVVGAVAALSATPLGRFFVRAPDAAPLAEPPVPGAPAPRPADEEDPLRRDADRLRRRADALEAEMTQSPVEGFGDPREKALQEIRQRLRVLEGELGATEP